jgi:hypothetical protein
MALQVWSTKSFGCIERDSFRLRPVPRIAVTSLDVSPMVAKRADVAAPIEASFQLTQSRAQHAAFTQWHKYDLAGGARPFLIDLWLWNQVRRVRARFLGEWRAKREGFYVYVLTGTFEIERESLGMSVPPPPLPPPLVVDLTPVSLSGECYTMASPTCSAGTGTVTATASGGTEPYTFLWEHVSGDTFTVSAPNSPTTSFARSAGQSNTLVGTYRCRVSDPLGYIAYTPAVTITLSYLGSPTMVVSLTPTSLSGGCVTDGYVAQCAAGAGPVSASVVSGGAAPFTYLWEHVSGSSFTLTAPNAASTSFSRTADPGTLVGVYRCKITDAAGQVAYTTNATITLTYTYGAPSHTFPIATLNCRSTRSGSNATARYVLELDGDIMATQFTNTLVDRGDWISPKTDMTEYEALGTMVSGTLTGGTAGSWISLGTLDRSWTIATTTIELVSCSFDLTLRRASDALVVAGPVRITLTAEREP